MTTYRVIRMYRDLDKREVVAEGLTQQEAQEHCRSKQTSSSTCTDAEGAERTDKFGPWFDGYEEE